VAKTLADNGTSLNLIMRKTFIKMGLNLAYLTSVYDTFHSVISGQSSTPNERIDLKVSCGSGDNKHREMLTFVVTSFDISYNCILGRSFLLKFMAVIHTTYATIKMLGPNSAITIKADQRDTLACENASLSHVGHLCDKPSTLKPPTGSTPRAPATQKDTYIASTSNQPPADQRADNKLKGTAAAEDKEVLVDPNNPDKKLRINSNLDPK
jgi:hypothetical protein